MTPTDHMSKDRLKPLFRNTSGAEIREPDKIVVINRELTDGQMGSAGLAGILTSGLDGLLLRVEQDKFTARGGRANRAAPVRRPNWLGSVLL